MQAALETGHMLKLSHDQFIALIESAWQADQERREAEKNEGKEEKS